MEVFAFGSLLPKLMVGVGGLAHVSKEGSREMGSSEPPWKGHALRTLLLSFFYVDFTRTVQSGLAFSFLSL